MMKKIKAKKLEYIELTEKLNCIPPGVYKVVEMGSESIQLSVSDRIGIGMIGDYGKWVKCISKNEGIMRRIKRDDFLSQYYFFLDTASSKIPDWSKPFTFCFLDEFLETEFRSKQKGAEKSSQHERVS